MIAGLRRMTTHMRARSQAIGNSVNPLSRFREDMIRLWSDTHLHLHLLEPAVARRLARGSNVNLNVHPIPVNLGDEIGGSIPPISGFIRM
jgi:hypothetical protein